MVKTNTVGGLISLKWPQNGEKKNNKRARKRPKGRRSRDLQQMMTQFRMRCDYLDATQWISELWTLISGFFFF